MTNEELSNTKNFKLLSNIIGKKYPWIISVYPDPYNDEETHSKTDSKWKNYFLIFVVDGNKIAREFGLDFKSFFNMKDIPSLSVLANNPEEEKKLKDADNELDNFLKLFRDSEVIPNELKLVETEGRYLIGGYDIEKKKNDKRRVK